MLLDAHAHLDQYRDAKELREALNEIEREKIFTVSVAMDGESYERTVKLAKGFPHVLPTFGIHPWEAPKHTRHLDSFRPLLEQTPMIGEIGLDHRFVKDRELWPAQRKVFEFLLTEAREQKKIVNVHTSGAEEEALQLLEEHEIERAIVHWYNGPAETFRKLAARGCAFTFGIELRTSEHIRALAKEAPAELILTETDNPGGAKFLYGEQGMPRILGRVVQDLAKARETTPAAIAEIVAANFARLIRDDPHMAAAQRYFPA